MTDYSRVYSGKLHRHSINNTNDYISRQAAIKALIGGSLSAATLYGRTEEGMTVLREYTNNIRRIPSADVRENVKAQKVIGGGEHDGATCWFECSKCGQTVDVDDVFCKRCGAQFGE